MKKGNTVLLAALGGAVVGALVANFLTTERGQQLLTSASESLKDIGGKATEYAKSNLGQVLQETKSSVGEVVKEKIAQQFSK
jgi:gas vesicle protein